MPLAGIGSPAMLWATILSAIRHRIQFPGCARAQRIAVLTHQCARKRGLGIRIIEENENNYPFVPQRLASRACAGARANVVFCPRVEGCFFSGIPFSHRSCTALVFIFVSDGCFEMISDSQQNGCSTPDPTGGSPRALGDLAQIQYEDDRLLEMLAIGREFA